MNSEKTLMKYGFVSILLIASFLMAVPANQYQKVLAQSEGESSEDNQGNTTQVQENVTDAEIPSFENQNATFVPPPEGDREAPPIPADAIKGADLRKETPPKDSDSQPLSVSNRTELLEVLPANSTKIIEHVDQDLKNSTGEGLLPPAILDKIITGEGQNNDTILDISTPQELDEIKNFSDSTTNQTTEEAIDEGEPIANITNATGLGGLPEAGKMNATNATQEETQGNEEQAQTGEAVNMTNATSGPEGDKKSSDNQDQQTGAGEEQTNITNATSAIEPNMTSAITGEEQQSQDQQQTGDEGDKKSSDNQDQQTGDEGDKKSSDNQDQQTGAGEEQTNITNATSAIEPNMTSAITGEEQQSQDQQQTGDEGEKKSSDNQDQQTGDEGDKKSSDNQDQQTGAGEEQTNITNATSAIEPNMTSAITGEEQQSQDQQQTGDEG